MYEWLQAQTGLDVELLKLLVTNVATGILSPAFLWLCRWMWRKLPSHKPWQPGTEAGLVLGMLGDKHAGWRLAGEGISNGTVGVLAGKSVLVNARDITRRLTRRERKTIYAAAREWLKVLRINAANSETAAIRAALEDAATRPAKGAPTVDDTAEHAPLPPVAGTVTAADDRQHAAQTMAYHMDANLGPEDVRRLHGRREGNSNKPYRPQP